MWPEDEEKENPNSNPIVKFGHVALQRKNVLGVLVDHVCLEKNEITLTIDTPEGGTTVDADGEIACETMIHDYESWAGTKFPTFMYNPVIRERVRAHSQD